MEIRGHEIIHRKYPDIGWEFKAVTMEILDDDGKVKDVVYGISKDKGRKKSISVEIYSGRNYIVGSNHNSYSRKYNMRGVPTKYADVVQKAISIHKKTKWSTAKYVNKN